MTNVTRAEQIASRAFIDPITQLDNTKESMIRDAIRAEYIVTRFVESTPDYIAEWNKRFNDRTAFSCSDMNGRSILYRLGDKYGIDPATL